MYSIEEVKRKTKNLKAFITIPQYNKLIDVLDSIITNIEGYSDEVVTALITEAVVGAGVTIDDFVVKDGGFIKKPTAVAIDVTATATAAQIASGYITSSTAAAVSITTPSATDLATALGITGVGEFDFVVENTGSTNAITIVLGSGITAATPVITGGGTLTISAANDVGLFKLVFTSPTVAKIFRIG